MTEEQNDRESASPQKLSVDDPLNFLFHAAYLAYSDAYDKTSSPEAREQLNESILALQQNQIDYSAFYEKIARFRGEDFSRRGFGRAPIKTQNKREWRRKTQKHNRIERHRK
jgi:hypothetical protein